MTLPFIKLFQQKKKSTIFLGFITPPPFPLEAFLVIDELLRAPLVAQRVKCLPPMQKTRVRSLQCRRPGFDPWVGKIPWRRKWQPTSVLLPGKFHGLRSLIGYSLWGCKESDMTEQLHFHFLYGSLTVCKESYNKPRQSIKKQRHQFADKGPYSQSYGFTCSQEQMWELDHKEGLAQKNWCFQFMVLEKILESPLEGKEIKSVNPKQNQL